MPAVDRGVIALELGRYLSGRGTAAPVWARLLQVTLAPELEALRVAAGVPAAIESIAVALVDGLLPALRGLSPAELARTCRRTWDCDLDSDAARVLLSELAGLEPGGPIRSRWPSLDRFGAVVAEYLEPERVRRLARAALRPWRGSLELARYLGTEWQAAFGGLSAPCQSGLDLVALVERAEHRAVARELARRLGRAGRGSRRRAQPFGGLPPSRLRLGSELSCVLPSELALLSHPSTRPLFLDRFASGKLAVVERHADDRRHERGPIVVLLDASGSMAGEPELDAKAIVLALARELRRERRRLQVIQFSGPNEQHACEIEPGREGLERLLALLGRSFHGATDFDAALQSAFASLDAISFRRADLVMVSDGKGRFSPASRWLLGNLAQRWGTRFEQVTVPLAQPRAELPGAAP
jgi:Mg-chelatase subunit ChlD